MRILKTYSVKIRQLIVLIAVLLFIVAPYVSYTHRNIEPTYIARDESPIEGSIGYTISKTPHAPQTSIVVYNGTVNDPSADWYLRYGYFYQIHDDTRGVMLDLEGTGTTPIGNTLDSVVGFTGRPTLPLMNYSEICFSIDVNVIQGSANVSLRVFYNAWPDNDWNEAGENYTYLEENQSETIIIKPPLSGAYNLSSGWAIRTSMVVRVTSSEESRVRIGDVVISVDSNENLYPVTFDMQATDGESLFHNPYMSVLRGTASYIYYDYPKYPAVELTRTGNSTDFSIFGPRSTNETLYLAEGNYEGVAGWFYKYGRMSNSVFNISFTVGPDESILIANRIPTNRLFIDIYPSFAYSRVFINSQYGFDFPLHDAEYLYMPNGTSFGISVWPLYGKYQGIEAGSFGIQTNGTSSVRVTVVYSSFSIFGIILDWGQILGIVGTALLLLVLIQGGAKRSFAGARTDYNLRTNLLPVSFYFISMFFPWMTSSFDTNAVPPSTVSSVIMVPLFTSLWWTPQSQLTPAINTFQLLNVFVIVLLYWIPIIYLSYLIATRPNSISDELIEEDSLLSAGVFGGPFIVGCYYVWLCITGLFQLNIGLIAALLTLPSWGVASWLRWRNDQPQTTDNSQKNNSARRWDA
ncbi:MAG: hypothetical protein RTV72_15165 [Candidatus Thorarchaeota archaeon]